VEVALERPLADERALQREIDPVAGPRVPEEARAELVSVQLSSVAERDALIRLRQSMQLVAPQLALSARIDPGWLAGASEGELRAWLGAADRLQVPCDELSRDGFQRTVGELLARAAGSRTAILIEAKSAGGDMEQAVEIALGAAAVAGRVEGSPLLLALSPSPAFSPLHAYRLLAARLDREARRTPLLLLDDPATRRVDALLGPSAALGGLLCDGLGDALQLAPGTEHDPRRLAFGILQAARVRITRTEFISCPSCGRTLFDLEETTARIKARTAHLKGLKIAVMGCVVNGPGEMADADFGYVGWGDGKIALFVGREMVARDIPTAEADERLVQLIKEHGRWIEPQPEAVEKR
jgi:hypothetical protein